MDEYLQNLVVIFQWMNVWIWKEKHRWKLNFDGMKFIHVITVTKGPLG